jgi:hypothetical protein
MAGFEPATTGLQGEVTVLCATGRIVLLLCEIQGTSEMSFGVSAQRNLVLRGDASVPLSLCSSRVFYPCISLVVEVTRLFHHWTSCADAARRLRGKRIPVRE